MSEFHPTELTLSDLSESIVTPVRVANRNVVFTLLDGKPYAFLGICPHAAGDLRRGDIRRGQISCPMHGWKFDVKTGRCSSPPDESSRLKRFDVQMDESGKLSVDIG